MSTEIINNEVASPCVAVCALDENDICIGCHRSGDEITQWSQMNNEQKQQVMLKVCEREKRAYI